MTNVSVDSTQTRLSSFSSSRKSNLKYLLTSNELKQYPYRDPDRLQTVYGQVGTITGTATHFDVSDTAVRFWLIHHEIYDPESDGLSSIANRLEKLSPEDLGLSPLGDHQ